jgi:4-amino-4-deoxy-L-arabinose transferase-like glycosyltransferase
MRSQAGARFLWAAIGASALAHLVLAARLPILDDEAYYLLWAQRLAWGYPDHPPMIAALVAASARLFGTSPLGLRVLPIVVAAATAVVAYLAARDLFDRATALRSTLLLLVMPATAIGTAFAFPDTPLALFWALCLWTGWRALTAGGVWWLAAGVATGLALLSKLTGLAFVLGLAAVWVTGDRRSAAHGLWPYASALVALAIFAPVVAWNVRHDWALVAMTLHREPWVLDRPVLENLALFIAGQLGYYGLLAPLLVGAGVAAARRAREPAWRYVAWMTLPLLLVMGAAALNGATKPHWPGPAYLSAAIALGALWPEWSRARPRLVRAATGLTALLSLALFLAAVLAWAWVAPRADINRWDPIAAAIDRHLERLPGQTVVVTDGYQAASLLAYYLRTPAPVTAFRGAFVYWQEPRVWSGRTALYVDEIGVRRKADVARLCRQITALETLPLSPWRTVRLHRCDDARFP